VPCPFGLLAALALLLAAPSLAAESVAIDDLIVAATIPEAQREATLKAVRAFYEFWNTGDEALLKQAIAENFTDRTLPPGRPGRLGRGEDAGIVVRPLFCLFLRPLFLCSPVFSLFENVHRNELGRFVACVLDPVVAFFALGEAITGA
jgi:hypothetical protein